MSAPDAHIEDRDVLIIGAGLSGINTAHIFQERFPRRSYAILEARSVIGGTWNLFRYPGFRSDSSMIAFGFTWHTWPHEHRIASGPEIAAYLQDAAETSGIMDKILFKHKVVGYEWRTEDRAWTLDVDADGTRKTFRANFILACTGFYSYDRAMEAIIPGIDSFAGRVIHPQWWPESFDYANKRIAVIGSGSTSTTIIPTLAKTAKQVTMIQRSPSFYVEMPSKSRSEPWLRTFLPLSWVIWIIWCKDTFLEVFFSLLALRYPGIVRSILISETKKQLPKNMDVDRHFNPRYNPFQQRILVCPDGDFFKTMHRDNCEIVTDVINTVKSGGIQLGSGRTIKADVLVTATGLYVQLLNGVKPVVDGQPIDPGAKYAWRGCMLDGLPNMSFVIGYATTSWTPGANMMAQILMRVLKTMDQKHATTVMPVLGRRPAKDAPLAIAATSTFFRKAADRIPKVANEGPWYGRTNLIFDMWVRWFGNVENGLVFE